MSNIDLVITFVDNTDKNWIKEVNEYLKYECDGTIDYRFKCHSFIKYGFRMIEKNVSFIRKVFLIVSNDSQVPKWLNRNNEKLVILKHEDFIDKKYLPTFSPQTIELNFHNIKDLSETFIYANDDMFFLNKCNVDDFFINSLPSDLLHISPITRSTSKYFKHIMLNNIAFINRNYSINDIALKRREILINDVYDEKIVNDNKNSLYYDKFIGFSYAHMPQAYLKSTYKKIWEMEPKLLDSICKRKFRNSLLDINNYVCRYVALLDGNFVSRKKYLDNEYTEIGVSFSEIEKIILSNKKCICINEDDDGISDSCIDIYENKIRDVFEKIFRNKSSFEL